MDSTPAFNPSVFVPFITAYDFADTVFCFVVVL